MVIGFQIRKLHRGAESAPPPAVLDSKKPGLFRVNELKSVVQYELTSLMHWIQANKLTINYYPKKSSCCVFKPASKNLPSTYKEGIKMGNNTLSYKETTTYLGLILDSKLT